MGVRRWCRFGFEDGADLVQDEDLVGARREFSAILEQEDRAAARRPDARHRGHHRAQQDVIVRFRPSRSRSASRGRRNRQDGRRPATGGVPPRDRHQLTRQGVMVVGPTPASCASSATCRPRSARSRRRVDDRGAGRTALRERTREWSSAARACRLATLKATRGGRGAEPASVVARHHAAEGLVVPRAPAGRRRPTGRGLVASLRGRACVRAARAMVAQALAHRILRAVGVGQRVPYDPVQNAVAPASR